MNVQLNHILARQRAAELLITRLKARPARAFGALIVPVMFAVLAPRAPAAMADPVGQITEFSTGLNTGADER